MPFITYQKYDQNLVTIIFMSAFTILSIDLSLFNIIDSHIKENNIIYNFISYCFIITINFANI